MVMEGMDEKKKEFLFCFDPRGCCAMWTFFFCFFFLLEDYGKEENL